MASHYYRCFILTKPSIRLVTILYFICLISSWAGYIDCQIDHKCSHIPPQQDNINHIWLIDNKETGNDKGETEIDYVMVDRNYTIDNAPSSNRERSANNLSKRQAKQYYKELINTDRNYLQTDLTSVRRKESNILNHYNQQGSLNRGNDNLIPMKISVYYDESVDKLRKPESILIKETIMPSVIKFFESALSIRRDLTIDNFRISRRCVNITYAKDNNGMPKPFCLNKCDDYSICGEMLVPPSHLAGCSYCNVTSRKCYTNHSLEGKGVSDTQLLIYVSAKQTSRCGREQTIAYAAHCAQDSKTDRPVAGHANLCPSSISADPKDVSSLIATVKHELTHVLGLSVSLFAYYRDHNGEPLTDRRQWNLMNPGNHPPKDPKTGYPIWSEKIIKKIIRRGWISGEGPVDKEVYLLATPTVIREVRSHFNCSTLEGAELEDQGHDGTSMTHWEKRLFENEAMTGTHTHNSVYSRLTLAALQDTGWYVANFSVAERLYWGKDLGCEFATQSCKYWMDKRRLVNESLYPFCDRIKSDLLQITCSSDHTAKAVCNMRKHKQPLAEFYRHFDTLDGVHRDDLSLYGGTVDLADYCPFVQEYTLQQHPITIRGSRCSHSNNNLDPDKNLALESFGPQSKCFIHGRRWTNRSCSFKQRGWPHHGAGCYKTSCYSGFLTISIHNVNYNCYYKGQEINILHELHNTVYNGSIICPSCDLMCPPNSCKNYNKIIIDDIMTNLKARYPIQVRNETSGFSIYEILFQFYSKRPTMMNSTESHLSPFVSSDESDSQSRQNEIFTTDSNIINHYSSQENDLIRHWNDLIKTKSNQQTIKDTNNLLKYYEIDEHLKIYLIIGQQLKSTASQIVLSSNPSSHTCSTATNNRIPNYEVILLYYIMAYIITALVFTSHKKI